MKKRFLSLIVALLAVLVLVGCGKTPETTTAASVDLSGKYQVKVWVDQKIVELTKTQIEEFNANNGQGITIEATIEPTGEGDAATNMITDVENGADLFNFAQDQLGRLVEANAVSRLGQAASKFVQDNNDADSVKAVTLSDQVYAYPVTSDNGYFMYYDKSVITDETHLNSLEQLIADCEAAKKAFAFKVLTSGWYSAAFFFGAGCESTFAIDSNGMVTGLTDTYNSANGLIAMKGMQKLLNSPYFVSDDASTVCTAATPAAVFVSGTWAATDVKAAWGDNMGVAKLPCFTVDGKQVQLGSFKGFKMMGVKPQEDAKKAAVLNMLAQYLTGEKCQLDRYTNNAWGPSNKAAQQNEAVKNDPILKALYAQNAFATPQGQYPGQWWDVTQTLAAACKSATSDADMTTALAAYEKAMKDLIGKMPASAANGPWGAIGVGGDWSNDKAMTKQEDGSFLSDEAFTFAAGDEFKVRLDASWDHAFGDPSVATAGNNNPNYKVETAGKYKIKLVLTDASKYEGHIELVPAE